MTETTTYATGPTNDNYGYDPDLVAPIEQVREAARLDGDAMWEALQGCDWTERDDLPEGARVVSTYYDGRLRVAPDEGERTVYPDTETITIDEALDRIEAAARAHGHGFMVRRDNTAVYLSRELSRGRRQQVGSIELVSDGTEVDVEIYAQRQRATVRDIAETALRGVTVKE